MAHNYPKIIAPFNRETSKDKLVKEGNWFTPAFEYLKDVEWIWEEKLDGTSIGLKWDGDKISIVGHTEKSQIPPKLKKYLTDNFLTSEFESVIESIFGDMNISLYGEGLSSETNENYGHPDGYFVMFDIYNELGHYWYSREYVEEISKKLGIEKATVIMTGTISDAVDYIKNGGYSLTNPHDSTRQLEGLVGRTKYELMYNGQRMITKVKVKDFCRKE